VVRPIRNPCGERDCTLTYPGSKKNDGPDRGFLETGLWKEKRRKTSGFQVWKNFRRGVFPKKGGGV